MFERRPGSVRVRCLLVTAATLCIASAPTGCGDDDGEPAADGGVDSGGESGTGGRGGQGGGGGASAAGRGGAGGSGGSGSTLQAVTIRFKAKVGDQDLVCGQNYSGQGSSKLTATPQDFRFFVEEVRLVTRDGEERRMQFDERAPFQTREVALIDFTDGKGNCRTGGASVNTTISGRIVPGEYEGIVFVNGVPESLNHQNIAVAKPPLQDATTYWGWQSGYRFIMADLRALDVAPHDAGPADDAGAGPHGSTPGVSMVHVGSAGCTATGATEFTCSRPNRNKVKLSGFKPGSSTIVADLSKVFEPVDLSDPVECHGPAPRCGESYAALGVDFMSGAALETQQVFRVE